MLKNLLFLVLSIVLIACSSDDNSNNTTTDPDVIEEEVTVDPGFYGLVIGNSWSYSAYKRGASSGDGTFKYIPNGITYTLTITDTEEIDGETFFVRTYNTTGNETGSSIFPANGITTDRVRDSLGYLINDDGYIIYSSRNEIPYLKSSRPFGDTYGELLREPMTVEVEAGVFSCRVNTNYAILSASGERAPGTSYLYFVEGQGLVRYHIAAVATTEHLWEIRLDSFDLVD